MTTRPDVILSIQDLVASFDSDQGWTTVLDRISFDLGRGETLGVVGESG